MSLIRHHHKRGLDINIARSHSDGVTAVVTVRGIVTYAATI